MLSSLAAPVLNNVLLPPVRLPSGFYQKDSAEAHGHQLQQRYPLHPAGAMPCSQILAFASQIWHTNFLYALSRPTDSSMSAGQIWQVHNGAQFPNSTL